MSKPASLAMDAAALGGFLAREFPQVRDDFAIEEAAPMRLRVRLNVAERHLRPGGTISGPSMFALADVAVYLAVLAMIGPNALAVTTNCSVDFMRKPTAGVDLIGSVAKLTPPAFRAAVGHGKLEERRWQGAGGRQMAIGFKGVHYPKLVVLHAAFFYLRHAVS